MSKIIKKKDFFNDYFKSMSTSVNKKIKKEIYTNLIDSVQDKNLEIISNKTVNMVINLELKLPINLFTHNFKNNLVDYIKKKYESRAYYIFFLDYIDYTYVLDYELPLCKKVGELIWINIPVMSRLIIFKKKDVVETKLLLNTQYNDEKISVYATNEYIYCKINLKFSQIILKNSSKDIELFDKFTNKKYKNNDIIHVKLLEFYNNQLETGFTSKINCSGEIKI